MQDQVDDWLDNLATAYSAAATKEDRERVLLDFRAAIGGETVDLKRRVFEALAKPIVADFRSLPRG